MREPVDDIQKLQQLRAHYGKKVRWVDKKHDIMQSDYDEGITCVQIKGSGLSIQARIVRENKRSSKWMSPFDLERWLEVEVETANARLLAGREIEVAKDPTSLMPVNQRRKILGDKLTTQDKLQKAYSWLREFNARWEWVNSHFLHVWIPEYRDTPPWQGWMKFVEKEPRRRKWSDKMRTRMHAAGVYTWAAEWYTDDRYFRLHYIGPGSRNQYRTQWAPVTMLHEELITATKFANENDWRHREIQEVDFVAQLKSMTDAEKVAYSLKYTGAAEVHRKLAAEREQTAKQIQKVSDALRTGEGMDELDKVPTEIMNELGELEWEDEDWGPDPTTPSGFIADPSVRWTGEQEFLNEKIIDRTKLK